MKNDEIQEKVREIAIATNGSLPDVLPITRAKMATEVALDKVIFSLTLKEVLTLLPDREFEMVIADIYSVYGVNVFEEISSMNTFHGDREL